MSRRLNTILIMLVVGMVVAAIFIPFDPPGVKEVIPEFDTEDAFAGREQVKVTCKMPSGIGLPGSRTGTSRYRTYLVDAQEQAMNRAMNRRGWYADITGFPRGTVTIYKNGREQFEFQFNCWVISRRRDPGR
jgi:hypothetical protein